MNILLDTCIIIDYLREKKEALDYINTFDTAPYISVITISELLTGARNKREREQIQVIINASTVLDINEEISVIAGNLLNKFYRSHGVGLGDGLIAATAQYHNLDVATCNIKHFPMFDGIKKPYQ